MGARCLTWLGSSACACAIGFATFGCGESSSPDEQAPETGGGAGVGSGGGAGSTGGGAGTGASASGSASFGGSGGSSSGGSTTSGGASGASGGSSSGGSTTSGGASGGGGASAGGSGAAGGLECPSVDAIDDEGFVVTIEPDQRLVFQRDLLWYAGRPPLLDLSALTDAPGWTGFRMVIDPDDATVTPGVYRSGPGNVTYVQARAEGAEYDSIDNDASIICVLSAGTEPGALVEGTFAAVLENYDGTTSLRVSGTFSGVLE